MVNRILNNILDLSQNQKIGTAIFIVAIIIVAVLTQKKKKSISIYDIDKIDLK